eukprot:TRINITY_DN5539_c0_g1_i7.p1 TRINITY_DN5539_c0_g1~~TRINITY_DN5539_c0_g1_i7.p1  ORF type:complete len:157 (+),score=37.21 TRINITY_DN5539_c0_g1_i7:318-788(+)
MAVKQIIDFIETKSPQNDRSKWHQLLDGNVGLLVNERLVNVPKALVPTLHETIYEEIDWAVEDGKDFVVNTFIYFTSYLHQDLEAPDLAGPRQNKKKKGSAKNWPKFEDAIYLKHSDLSFTVPVNHSETRLIMSFSKDSVHKIMKDIHKLQEQFIW